ncbi:MAG: hypothetical protein P1P88_14895 [Bacteroidales bacterium]|nr:hypothetical protein [Bacteroidales bacterium]
MTKRIRAVFLTAFLSSSSLIFAQEGFSNWEKSYFEKNASSQQREFVNNISLPEKIEVPKIKTNSNSLKEKKIWDVFLKRSVAAFLTEPKSYAYNKKVALVYGVLNLGNFDVFYYHEALKNNMNDTAWVENSFLELLPLIKQSWYLLDKETRDLYISIIKHCENYLKSFDYEQEKKYYAQLILLEQEDKFISNSCKSTSINEFRKAEAFIFRRINDAKENQGNWTKKWTMKMLRKLRRSLLIA